jgi:hypothetical protein
MRTRTFARCPIFPLFIFASSAAMCSNERAGHTGHSVFFLLCRTPLPILLLPRSTPFSFSLPELRSSYLCSVIYPSFELFAARGLLRAYKVEPTARGRLLDLPSFFIFSCNRGPTGCNLVILFGVSLLQDAPFFYLQPPGFLFPSA